MPIAGDKRWAKPAYIDQDGKLIIVERQTYYPGDRIKSSLDEALDLLAQGKTIYIDAVGSFSTYLREAWNEKKE